MLMILDAMVRFRFGESHYICLGENRGIGSVEVMCKFVQTDSM